MYVEIARRVIARQRALQDAVAAQPAPPLRTPPDIDDYLAVFYERAAICEFDGRLDRIDAERHGMRQVLATFGKFGLKE